MRRMYHVTKAPRDLIEQDGLRARGGEHKVKRFTSDRKSRFNLAGVYVYDDIAITRRLFPRSHVDLYAVDVTGLPLSPDRWGGEGAWRIEQDVPPERVEWLHAYEPWEKPLAADPGEMR